MNDEMPTPEEERAWKLMAAQLEAMREPLPAGAAARDPAEAEFAQLDERFCSRLAMVLECVLAEYNGRHYDEALETLGEYASAREAIHQRHCSTFMGETLNWEARK